MAASFMKQKIRKFIKKKIRNICEGQVRKIFFGSDVFFIQNGGLLLEERVSLFHGKTNPVRCFSVDELNTMVTKFNVDIKDGVEYFNGSFDGRAVLIKGGKPWNLEVIPREVAVSMAMSTHTNVLKLLGCCLETENPVLVYEVAENGTLQSRIFQGPPLEWMDRLRIAWEISHAVAYLHTGFPRPIIHRDLKPSNVFLDKDNVAKLSGFYLSISIPPGETHVEDEVAGTFGYLDPKYFDTGMVSESADVYAFGILFLVLLTGRNAIDKRSPLIDLIRQDFKNMSINEIVDPRMFVNGAMPEDVVFQLRKSIDLAVRCASLEEYSRPTMVEVAIELKGIMTTYSHTPATT